MSAVWRWKRGRPTVSLDVVAGTGVVLDLGLAWDGAPPRVDWELVPPLQDAVPDPSVPGLLRADLMPDTKGFCSLRVRIEGEPAWSGVVRIRIRPGEREDAPPPPPPAALPVAPLPAGRAYRVVVLRGGVRVPALTRPVIEGRTLRVGRFSAGRGILPDLDLTGQFGSDGDPSRCSREQAEVFWSQGAILLVSRGRSPLVHLPETGEPTPLAGPVGWLPGERYGVPGGLVLMLEEEP
jgi:hypothetical protein